MYKTFPKGFLFVHSLGQRHDGIVAAGHVAYILVALNILFIWLARVRKQYGVSFYSILLAKFLLQDLPMQFCIASFLYGWYGKGGLRCQVF